MCQCEHHPFFVVYKAYLEKILLENALDASVARWRLVMLATWGHKYSHLCHHCSVNTPSSWIAFSSCSLGSIQALVYTLPPWMTLVVFVPTCRCTIHRITSSSLLPIPSPSSLARLPFLRLVERLPWCHICTHKEVKNESFIIRNVCTKDKSAKWI